MTNTTEQPMVRAHARALQELVAWPAALFRACLFLLAVSVAGAMFRTAYLVATALLGFSSVTPWWWLPTGAVGIALYLRAARWSGGRQLRRDIRADLRAGVVAVERLAVTEAIEVEEREDEGPGYILRTADGRTLVFAGQHIERYRRKGFPWRAFDVVNAPRSGVFLDLVAQGTTLPASSRRPPFSIEELRKYSGDAGSAYQLLDEG